MNSWILFAVLSTSAVSNIAMVTQSELPEDQHSTVVVAAECESPTGGIQEAIDTLGSDGGIITIPPGRYQLRRSIRIRSHVTLQGSGETTVLCKVAQVGSRLVVPTDAESRSVQVQDTTGFQVAIPSPKWG